MSFDCDLAARLSVSTSKAVGAATARGTMAANVYHQFPEGTASGEANLAASVKPTLAAGAHLDLDLSGGVVDIYGGSVAFAVIKALMVEVPAEADGPVEIGGAASNAFAALFGAAAHTVLVEPGGTLLVSAPLDGYAVADTTADLLRITNTGTVDVQPTVTLVGVAA